MEADIYQNVCLSLIVLCCIAIMFLLGILLKVVKTRQIGFEEMELIKANFLQLVSANKEFKESMDCVDEQLKTYKSQINEIKRTINKTSG